MYLCFDEPFNKFSLGTSLLCTLLTLLPGLSISIGNESGSGQVHKARDAAGKLLKMCPALSASGVILRTTGLNAAVLYRVFLFHLTT